MASSMFFLIVGPSQTSAEQLRKRLGDTGFPCPPSASMTLDTALESLERWNRQPDVVFFQCAGKTAEDRLALNRLRAVTTSEIAAVDSPHEPTRNPIDLVRAGASDVLMHTERFQEELTSLIDRLQERPRSAAPRGAVHSVVSVSGGCGASTIAVNMAAALAGMHRKCGLLELQFDGGDLEVMLNLRPTATFADLAEAGMALDAEMLTDSLAKHARGISLLPCPPAWNEFRAVPPEAVSHLLGVATSIFPQVVIDLEDVFHPEQMAAVAASDQLLLVIRLEFPCLVRTRRVLDFLDRINFPSDRVQLVVNRTSPREEIRPAQVKEALGRSISFFIPNDYPLAVTAANVGNPFVYESPGAALSKAVKKMAETLAPVK